MNKYRIAVPRIQCVDRFFGWAYAGFTDDAGTYRNFYFNSVNEDFFETMKIEVVAGRAFSSENPSDNRRAVMVNEAF